MFDSAASRLARGDVARLHGRHMRAETHCGGVKCLRPSSVGGGESVSLSGQVIANSPLSLLLWNVKAGGRGRAGRGEGIKHDSAVKTFVLYSRASPFTQSCHLFLKVYIFL